MTENDPFPPAPRDQAAPVIDHEPASLPPPIPPPASDRGKPARSGGGGSAVLTILLFLLLAGGLYYVWANPQSPGDSDAVAGLQRQIQAQATTAGQETVQLQQLAQQVQTLSDRVEKLEKAPPAPPAIAPDLGDLTKRVDDLTAKIAALESQPAPTAGAPPAAAPDNTDQQALAALSQKLDQVQSADKAALDQLQAQQKDALDQAQAAALAQQKAALDQAQAASAAQEKAAIDQLEGRIGKLEQGAGTVEDAATRATRLERVQAAVVALQAGQKLGDIPNAPPALAKFANQAPPTEAALRESFPALAAHAREVSAPETAHKTFLQRAFARLQESVTVREGDDVLVGDPAAGVLADAEVKVQNGDLQGAVQRLQALHGPAAAAMHGWVDQAQSLIAARAALASMAARG